ncbi:unnamed protein product [Urochloa humidicola]
MPRRPPRPRGEALRGVAGNGCFSSVASSSSSSQGRRPRRLPLRLLAVHVVAPLLFRSSIALPSPLDAIRAAKNQPPPSHGCHGEKLDAAATSSAAPAPGHHAPPPPLAAPSVPVAVPGVHRIHALHCKSAPTDDKAC